MALRPIILAESGIGIPRATNISTCGELRRQIVEAEHNVRLSHRIIRTDVDGDPAKFREQNQLTLIQARVDFEKLSCSELMLDMARFRQRLGYLSSAMN